MGNRVNMGMKEWDGFRMFLKLETKVLGYDARDKTSMAGWGIWTEKLERQKLHHYSLIKTFRTLDMIVTGNRNPLKDFIYRYKVIILTFLVVFGFFLICFYFQIIVMMTFKNHFSWGMIREEHNWMWEDGYGGYQSDPGTVSIFLMSSITFLFLI